MKTITAEWAPAVGDVIRYYDTRYKLVFLDEHTALFREVSDDGVVLHHSTMLYGRPGFDDEVRKMGLGGIQYIHSAATSPPSPAGTTQAGPDAAEKHASKGDWPEDFRGENGTYENKCSECGKAFMGHKHRVVCKVCAATTKPPVTIGDMVRAVEMARDFFSVKVGREFIIEAPIRDALDSALASLRGMRGESGVADELTRAKDLVAKYLYDLEREASADGRTLPARHRQVFSWAFDGIKIPSVDVHPTAPPPNGVSDAEGGGK